MLSGLVIFGGLLVLMSKVPLLKNFGHLPGDISIQNGNFSCYAPIVSMILLSIIISVILNIAARLINR